MKKILSLAVLMSGLVFTSMAQEGPRKGKDSRRGDSKMEMRNKTPEQIAQMRTDRLDQKVKLTDKQKKEVYSLHLNEAKSHKKQSEVRNKQHDARKKEMQASREKLNKILTPEQQRMVADRSGKHDSKRLHKKEGNNKPMREGVRGDRKRSIGVEGKTSNG